MVKRNSCTVSIRQPIDNSTKIIVKLKRDDTGWEVISNEKIRMKSCDDGEVTFFILSGLELKTGYSYQLILEVGDSNDINTSNTFCLKGKTCLF